MKKLIGGVLGAILVAAVTGCASAPVQFLPSSAPAPIQGYTVVGSEVTGTSDQVWVFGLGGSTDIQQARAYRDAMAKSQQADALVAMSIERHTICMFPFFSKVEISVTGTPVKFNK